MSVMDKLIKAMRVNDENYYDEYDEENYDDDDELIEEEEPETARRTPVRPERVEASAVEEEPIFTNKNRRRSPAESGGEIVPTSRPIRRKTSGDMEVRVVKPTSINEAREITDILLTNNTVVINMEGLEHDIAQRIIDFISGSCYAVNGNFMMISRYIFVITPANVDISGDAGAGTEAGMDSAGASYIRR